MSELETKHPDVLKNSTMVFMLFDVPITSGQAVAVIL